MSNESAAISLLPGTGGAAQDASTTVKGIAKTSVAPASPTDPIVVGTNDPRLQIATTSQNGLLSATDRIKLDSIEAGAQTRPIPGSGMSYDSETDTLNVVQSGWRQIDVWMSPEFSGAVLQAVGNGGDVGFSSGHDGSAKENFYAWGTNQTGVHEGDVFFRFQVPDTFVSWTNILVYHKQSVGADDAKLDVILYGTNNVAATIVGGSSLVNTSWTQATITISSGTFTPGQMATLVFKLSAGQNETQYLGRIKLNMSLS